MSLKNKKAQAWGFDLIMASMIFIAGILVFYLYTLNIPNQAENIINTLNYEGNIISDSLLSAGFPENWNNTNVISPGILSNNKINQTKLERFYNLSTSQYVLTKNLFNTKYQYYISTTPENLTIEGSEIPGMGSFPLNPESLIKITRVTIYEEKPITFNIYIWE